MCARLAFEKEHIKIRSTCHFSDNHFTIDTSEDFDLVWGERPPLDELARRP
jgi:hypothetical protein